MDGCVDDQDYNDGAQNDNPIGKLNARYRCLFAKPFHDYPPIFNSGSPRAKRDERGLYVLSIFTGDRHRLCQ
jgi:hypothetical protein